jgi:predicted kinase
MPKFIMLCGAPYSGKTTYRAYYQQTHPGEDYVVISSDHEMEELARAKGLVNKQGQVLSTDVFVQYYEEAKRLAGQKLQEALAAGKNIILDRGHVIREEREKVLSTVPDDYTKIAVFVDTPRETIIGRWKESNRQGVGKGVRSIDLKNRLDNLERPVKEEGFEEIMTVRPGDFTLTEEIIRNTDKYAFVPGTEPEKDPTWLDGRIFSNPFMKAAQALRNLGVRLAHRQTPSSSMEATTGYTGENPARENERW